MIQIPITLTSLDYTRPIIWNGTSLEFGKLTYSELEERIRNLRLNRSSTVSMITKIKLDLGKVRRFDFFALESNLRMIEKKMVHIVPLLKHLGYSQENMDERIRSYNSMVDLINELYLKFKDAGLPILETIKAQKVKIIVLQKRLQLMSTAVESMTLQESRMASRLRKIDGRMRGINGQLSKLFASLYVLNAGNFELSKVVAEISAYESVVRIKIAKATNDLEILIRRVCDINIAMLELLAELAFLDERLKVLESRAAGMKEDLLVAEDTLNRIEENLDILRNFYNVAKSKLQSIENYLATFIVGGENVYLDFGDIYTVVHVVPPPMPPCPDPEPCPIVDPCPPRPTQPKPTQPKQPTKSGGTSSRPKFAVSPGFKIGSNAIIEHYKNNLEETCHKISTTINNVGNWRFAQPQMSLNLGTAQNSNDFDISNDNDYAVLISVYVQLLFITQASAEFTLFVDSFSCKLAEAYVNTAGHIILDEKGLVIIGPKESGTIVDLVYNIIVPKNTKVGITTKAKVQYLTGEDNGEGLSKLDLSINGLAYKMLDSDLNVIHGQNPLLDRFDAYQGKENVINDFWNALEPTNSFNENAYEELEEEVEAEVSVPIRDQMQRVFINENQKYTNSLNNEIVGAIVLTKTNIKENSLDTIVYVDCFHDVVTREESLQEVQNAKVALSIDSTDKFTIVEVTDLESAKLSYDNLILPQ